jgi:acetyltransferase-like isoleucine patch superfamily enzyme
MSDDKKYYAHPSAFIEDDVSIGDGSKIWHLVQIRKGAKIGKKCILGKSVFIDTNVPIGDNVKIQNFVSVYHGVTIEDDVFVGPHVCFTNDYLPRANMPDWQLVETYVKKGVSIGANSTIVCGITLEEYAMIGAGSLVSKSVNHHELVYGNPAKLQGYVCYCGNILTKTKDPLPDNTLLQCEKCDKSVMI